MITKKDFYNKAGRPSDKETELIEKIINLASKDPEIESIVKSTPNASDYVGLKSILSKIQDGKPSPTGADFRKPNKVDSDFEEFTDNDSDNSSVKSKIKNPFDVNVSKNSSGNEFIADDKWLSNQMKRQKAGVFENKDYTPFQEEVIQRDYTSGDLHEVETDDFSETNSINEDENPENQDVTNQDLEDDIPEPDFVKSNYNETWAEEDIIEEEIRKDELDDSIGIENKSELDPKLKRKYAVQTAKALIGVYSKIVPYPFAKFSQLSDTKFKKLVYENRIDPNMEISTDGTTLVEYIKGYNKQVDRIMEVSEETKEEIKEPLIEVLMEKEIYLSPAQRLMLAVGSHIASLTANTFALRKDMNMTLEHFQQMHQANIESGKAPSKKESMSSVSMSSVETDNSPKQEDLISDLQTMISNQNQNNSQEILSEENGGIVVEEFDDFDED